MSQELIEVSSQWTQLVEASAIADQVARAHVLADYRQDKAPRTLSGQRDAIAVFEAYLTEAGVPMQGMADDLAPWSAVSAGLVNGFVRWCLARGYRIRSINNRLSVLRTYARLAAEAGHLPQERYQAITLVRTISHKEGRNLDAERAQTSVGTQKAEPTRISPAHVATIKQQLLAETMRVDTLASRDLLLFVLAAEHSLRCSELALLKRESLDLEAGLLRIYRKKGDRWQLHQLTPSALVAAQWYLQLCAVETWLFPGEQPGTGLATRSIYERFVAAGKRVSLEKLGPHDLRHYYATS